MLNIKALGTTFLITMSLGTMAQSRDYGKWKNLFNGKDLSGWHKLNGKGEWEAKNGEIIGTSVQSESNAFLATKQEYGNFILQFEVFLSAPLNSGVQIRSFRNPLKNGRVQGYQVEIDPSSRKWSAGIYEEAGRGWLYPLNYNPIAKQRLKLNQWNKYRVECIGSTIRTWINGIPAANLEDTERSTGFIALQVHATSDKTLVGKSIKWRNIQIQTDLKSASPLDTIHVVNYIPNNISAQENKNGYSLLWDGNSTKGWRGAYKTGFPEKGWEIKDGLLSVAPSGGAESTNGGDIVTEKKFSAFELEFDFRLTEGANSGIKYFVTESEGNKGSAIGLEYQILDDNKHPDAKLGREGNRTLGSLYDIKTSLKIKDSQKKIGEWNKGIIKAFPDQRVEYWLNGFKILEFKRGSEEFKKLVAESKHKVWTNFGMATEGRILLQDHGDKVSYRSIKIKELK